jgi:hypothetical protein
MLPIYRSQRCQVRADGPEGKRRGSLSDKPPGTTTEPTESRFRHSSKSQRKPCKGLVSQMHSTDRQKQRVRRQTGEMVVFKF